MSHNYHSIILDSCKAIREHRFSDVPVKHSVMHNTNTDTTYATFNIQSGDQVDDIQSISIIDVDDFVDNSDDYFGSSPYLSDEFKANNGNPDQFIPNVGCCHWEVADNYIYISGFFLHPNLRGKGLGKVVLAMSLKAIWERHPGKTIVLHANPHPSVSKSGGLNTNALVNFYRSTGIFQTLNEFADDFGFARITSSQIRKQSPWARKPRLARKVKKLGQTCLIATGYKVNDEAGDIYNSILQHAPAWIANGWQQVAR